MGCGKSTVARLLSRKLNRPFIDTDTAIAKRHLRPVEALFATYGESWFRKEEYRILQKLHKFENYIVATGGGMAANSQNWRLLEKETTIFLDLPFPVLWEKIKNTRRPLVRRGEAALRKIWESRLTYYELANLHVVHMSYDPYFFCERIMTFLQEN